MNKLSLKLLSSALLLSASMGSQATVFTQTQSADLSGLNTASQANRIDLFDLNLTGLDSAAIGDATLTLSIAGDFNSVCYLSFLGFGGSTNGECLYGTIEGLGPEFVLTDKNTSNNGPFDGGSNGSDIYPDSGGVVTYTSTIDLATLLPIISDGVLNMSFDRGGNVNGVSTFSSTISYEIADASVPEPSTLALAMMGLGVFGVSRRFRNKA